MTTALSSTSRTVSSVDASMNTSLLPRSRAPAAPATTNLCRGSVMTSVPSYSAATSERAASGWRVLRKSHRRTSPLSVRSTTVSFSRTKHIEHTVSPGANAAGTVCAGRWKGPRTGNTCSDPSHTGTHTTHPHPSMHTVETSPLRRPLP